MIKKIYLLLCLVLCTFCSGKLWSQTTFVLTQAPCNANGILTANFTGLTPPLTVTWYLPSGPVVHSGVSTLSDALTGYAGQSLFVTALDANNLIADGGYQGAYPFNYQVAVAQGACPAQGTATATVFGGAAPYTYQWTDAVTSTIVSTTNPATLPNGNYHVMITDANGCTNGSIYNNYDSIFLHSEAAFNYNFSVTPANCTNGSIAVTSITGSGVPPYTYLWSNGATTSSLSGLTAGVYSVTVTDAQGCSRTKTEHVNQAITIGANTTVTAATCIQNNGAIITFGSGGTPPYSYLYSNGGTTQTQSGLSAGVYTVTVTDANGCTGSNSAYVSASTPVNATFSTTPSSCTSPTGSATLTVSGGLAPYTITWSTSPVQTGLTASNLAPGNYMFHITDVNGCIRTGVVNVPPVNVVAANITVGNATCLQSNGSLTAAPSGGLAPYTYLWSNGATTAGISSLPPGNYSVHITDAVGCSVNKFKTVQSSSPVTIGLATTPASCIYANDGAIASTVLGGATPYTYSWSNGQSTATATGLAAGIHHLNVTDANGCVAHESTTVTYGNSNSCYCTITGTVYHDVNGNCIMDAGEAGIPNIQIHCAGFGYTYTNASGVYTFLVPSGSYTLSETVLATYPLAGCQSNAISVTAVAAANCTQTVNFANTINPLHDIKISQWNFNAAVPGNSYTQTCIISNQGTVAESNVLASYKTDGQINTPTISPSGIFTSPSANYYTTSGNPIASIAPGGTKVFSMNFFVPTNIPMGTNLAFTDSAVYTAPMSNWINDYSPWNNVNHHPAVIVSSYDPNFMEVSPKGNGTQGYITLNDTTLEYMVHFQNLGTYQAQNIVVIDTLSSNLDWKSLRPIYSSHNATVSINENGVLKYTFKNIQLPAKMYNDAASNGMFTFTIKQKPNLALGTQIKNQADIYFDYNEPVITNEVLNTLYDPTSIENPGNKDRFAFTVYPNPAKNSFTVVVDNKVANAATSLTVTDISGRVLATKEMKLQSGKQLIAMSAEALTDGVYFVNLNIAGRKSTQKLVIVK
jgi:uncharacterized repeat protein (TIGR01451 family)